MPVLKFAALVILFALAVLAPAYAQEEIRDRIVLEQRAEGWVETETARVVAILDSAGTAEQLASARGEMRALLQRIADGASWHVTRFDRSVDQAGLERWRTVAEARMPEKQLTGIADRAKALSKPGLQVRIGAIDFTPTLAERERVVGELRTVLYRQALEEVQRVNQSMPGRTYRIHQIEFAADGHGGPVPVMAPAAELRMESKQAADQGGDAAMPLAQRIVLRAIVVLTNQQ